MKNFLLIPLLLLTVWSITACGNSDGEPTTPEQPEMPEQPDGGDEDVSDAPELGGKGRYLVLYSSRTNNTERVAQQIRTILGCDILKVEPSTPYDNNYDAMLQRAREELAAIRQDKFPSIKTSVENFEDYDLVFVGYPIWHGSMATPMQTFLHEHAVKLAGKRIALFATSGSSGIATSAAEAERLCPDAAFSEKLLLTSSTLTQMESRVAAWLEKLGVSGKEPDASSLNINIIAGDRTITATMEDNAAGRDFLSRLPLDVTLDDYNNITEKIFYPSPALTTTGVTRGCTPVPGDMTIYVPWGNVAIFCKNWSQSNDLIKIGHIDGDGIEALRVAGNIQVKFEKKSYDD